MEFFLVSCASRSSPGGGPRDTIAPVLDTSFPANYSIRFDKRVIELVFDEYVNLSSPAQQIRISPPLREKPEVTQRGKRIFIELRDTLLKNTTYTISFGTAITDFTEGNVRKNFRYIFSTGEFIDSLRLAGNIRNAFTSKSDKELIVALYELRKDSKMDSVPYQQLPTYYSYVNEEGDFLLENIKYSKFLLFAFEDKLNKLEPSPKSRIAFYSDIIETDTNLRIIELYSFKPLEEQKFYSVRQKAEGQLQFNFNRPVKNFQLKTLSAPDTGFLQMGLKKDTLDYWFRSGADSLVFSFSEERIGTDTATVFIRKMNPQEWKLQMDFTQLKAGDTLRLISNLPMKIIDSSRINLISGGDSIPLQLWMNSPFELQAMPERKLPAMNYIIQSSALQNWYNKSNDSLNFALTLLKRENLGSLKFDVMTEDSASYILQISKTDGKFSWERNFNKNISVDLKNIRPGTYSAQIIVDSNKDGEWSSGSYFKGIQPEKIIRYTEPIEIRANWELEMDWNVIRASGKSDHDHPGN